MSAGSLYQYQVHGSRSKSSGGSEGYTGWPIHRIGSASPGTTGGKVTAVARWNAPKSSGGAKVSGYRVYGYRLNDRGTVVQTVRSSVRTASARSWQPTLKKGRWKFAVRAKNAVGWSLLSSRSNPVQAR